MLVHGFLCRGLSSGGTGDSGHSQQHLQPLEQSLAHSRCLCFAYVSLAPISYALRPSPAHLRIGALLHHGLFWAKKQQTRDGDISL